MPSLRIARHGDEGACGTARRSRASRQGGRAAVSGSACGCSPHSLAPAGKRSGAGCETLRYLPQLLCRLLYWFKLKSKLCLLLAKAHALFELHPSGLGCIRIDTSAYRNRLYRPMHYRHLSCEGSRHAIHVPHKLSPASRAHKRTCHHSQLALPYSSLARTTTCSCTRREIDQVRVWPCLEAARTHSSALVPGPESKSPGLMSALSAQCAHASPCE